MAQGKNFSAPAHRWLLAIWMAAFLLAIPAISPAQVPLPVGEQVEVFNSLPPAQQQALIRELQSQLPPAQRQAVLQALQG